MEVQTTAQFMDWLNGLKDRDGRVRIRTCIDRLAQGYPGDHRRLAGGVFELRLTVGPGYRVYYTYREAECIVLLCGGDKSSQARDVKRAQQMASTTRRLL